MIEIYNLYMAQKYAFALVINTVKHIKIQEDSGKMP